MTKKISLTYLQCKAVDAALQGVCTSPSPGAAEYSDGWDDHSIAASMMFDCSHISVAKVRKDTIGRVLRRSTSVDSRLAALEAKVANLSARLVPLEGRWGI